MTLLQARLVILFDEWTGIAFLAYLHTHDPVAFWPVFVVWAVAVYGVSYPLYWRRYAKVDRIWRMARATRETVDRDRDSGDSVIG